jgi:glutathione S-transferase
MIKQYQLPGSPYALRTRIVLHEKGLPFETIQMDRANKPAEVLAVSPSGRSPVLFDGDVCLPSSPVICEYLDERYPLPRLMPESPGARAQVRLLLAEITDDLAEVFPDLVRVFHRTPEAERKPAEMESVRAAAFEALTPFEQRLAGRPYLAGEALTLADVTLYTALRSITRLLKDDLSSCPKLKEWKARVEGRPAVQAALAEEPKR